MAILGAQVAIFHENTIVLILREDFEMWALPGGGIDPGESALETAVREAEEETGLQVELSRFVGIYFVPSLNAQDFNDHVALFAAKVTGGKLRPSVESPEVRFFAPDALPDNLIWWHRQRIDDAFSGVEGAFWRQDVPLFMQESAPSRAGLYAARDASSLSRSDFFLQYFGHTGKQQRKLPSSQPEQDSG